MRAGASFRSALRNWGTMEERTRSLTGSLLEVGLCRSMSNYEAIHELGRGRGADKGNIQHTRLLQYHGLPRGS